MKTFELPDHTLVTPEMLRKLDHVLVSVHPSALKNHLTMLLLKYLEHEHDALPSDFEDCIVDLNVLFEFLMVVEREMVRDDRNRLN